MAEEPVSLVCEAYSFDILGNPAMRWINMPFEIENSDMAFTCPTDAVVTQANEFRLSNCYFKFS
jgi:hypothetical protein